MITKNSSNNTAPAIICQTPSKTFCEVKERYIPQPITTKPSQRNLSKTNFMISNSCIGERRFFPDDCAIFFNLYATRTKKLRVSYNSQPAPTVPEAQAPGELESSA